MKRILCLSYLLIVASFTHPARAEEGEKHFQKENFSLSYPDEGWQLEEMAPPKGKQTTNLRLTSSGKAKLSVVVTWEELPKPFTEQELETRPPALASAFALPIALSIAEKKEENITSSVGLINLSNLSELSYRYLVSKPGTNKTTSIEGFVYRTEDAPQSLVMGAIISEGSRLPTDLTNEYYDRLAEAYSIVNSLELKAKG